MPTVESQSDERHYPGAVEHVADVPAAAIGDLRARSSSAGGGGQRGHRLESWQPHQAGATAAATATSAAAIAGLRHARLPVDVT